MSAGLISGRSRRLRTTGLVLLVAVLAMVAYGVLVLMPHHGGAHVAPAGSSPADLAARRALLTRVLFLYAYWSTCAVLLLGLLVVAWLDFREVARSYAAERAALWKRSIGSAHSQHDADE